MGFIGTLDIAVRTTDGRNFVTLEPLVYVTKAGERIEVPVGTTTDGASIPKEFWSILPPFGGYWLPSVLHDYLYRVTKRAKNECDDIYLEAMESVGVNFVTRMTIYEAVVYGGERAFTEDRMAILKQINDGQLV